MSKRKIKKTRKRCTFKSSYRSSDIQSKQKNRTVFLRACVFRCGSKNQAHLLKPSTGVMKKKEEKSLPVSCLLGITENRRFHNLQLSSKNNQIVQTNLAKFCHQKEIIRQFCRSNYTIRFDFDSKKSQFPHGEMRRSM